MFSHFHKIFDAFTATERRTWFTAIVVFLVAASLMSVQAFYHGTMIAPAEGGSYREGIVGQPAFLNPLIAQSDADRSMNELLWSGLLDLVEQYKISDDHTTWTFILKPDLVWTDGEPITTNDVLFTIEAIQDPETRSPLAPTWQGVIAERISEYEIRFTLKSPYAFFLDNVRELKVVPQHVFGTIPLSNLRLSDYNLEPVGSGPYTFLRLTKRKDGFITQYALTRNDEYPLEHALIPSFTLRFYETYEDAITAFNRKDIDGLGGLDYASAENLKINHTVSVLEMPRYYALFLNQNAAAPLKEKAVREALALAIDRERIIESALHGYATRAEGPLHASIPGYDAHIYEGDAFSLEKAREALEGAGWKPNKEGVRVKTIKNETLALDFEVVVPDIAFLKDTIATLKDDWARIGVRLTPLVMSPADIARETIRTRNYQMILFGNILKPNADVFSFWHSSERFSPGLNLSLYDSRKADALLEAIRKDFDEISRAEQLSELQTLIANEIPALFLFSPQYLYARPKDLGGFDAIFIATPAHRFMNVATWYLETARVFK